MPQCRQVVLDDTGSSAFVVIYAAQHLRYARALAISYAKPPERQTVSLLFVNIAQDIEIERADMGACSNKIPKHLL